jgi:cytochrome c biogenesis protein CcmG/thiol:disulfide interchange protein DsbE
MRALPFVSFLILALGMAAMLMQKNMLHDAGAPSNEPMPAITVTSLDGRTQWNAKTLEGHVTVINFFASWCTPCAAEMPELEALRKQFPALRIEGIAWNDDPKTLKKWLVKHGNPFRTTWLDADGNATIALGIKGIPETFVVDAKGVVRFRLSGPLTADMRAGEFGALITQLLAEAAGEK